MEGLKIINEEVVDMEIVNKERVVNLLRCLVQINTVNPPGNEKELASLLDVFVKDFGLETKIIESLENRSTIVIYLRGKNKNAKKLYFSGHLDTVPIGEDEWDYDPFEARVENGLIYGRGTCDMKGGVAALIEAMLILKESGTVLEHDIIFLGTAGEEVDCLGARTLIDNGVIENPGAIVIAEPTSLEVFIGHKGVLWLEISTFGKTAHGSMPKHGINAISNMLKILEELNNLELPLKDELLGSTTMSVNRIDGGVATNVIPDKCTVAVDIRTVTAATNELVIKSIEEVMRKLKSNDPSFVASISVLQNLRPLLNDSQDKFIQYAQKLNKDLNSKEIENIGVNYYTDAAIFGESLDCPIIIYGAGDEKLAHQPNENIEIESLIKSINYYVNLAKNFQDIY
ncbi:M20 family metallopeptidase [Lysinibacillus fusiformis]|uniref:M20 family metallopeptidase n=1 Tax=Lysinibacillus fusiformis TaxID=28031 RepID=UPI00381EF511